MIEFIVPGSPQGKARARITSYGAYTPEKTVLYENYIKHCFLSGYKNYTPSEKAIKVEIIAYFEVTKSTSKKNKELMLMGILRPTKKPDIDNICKVVCDALNGLAYKDDAQIVKVTIEKRYSDIARVQIVIKEVFGE